MTWQARLISGGLRLIEKRQLSRATDPIALRESFERKARLLFHAPGGTRLEPLTRDGCEALRISGPWVRQSTQILYFHGGAHIMGSPRTHAAMLGRLSQYSGMAAILLRYPLAPEHPFPAAIDVAQQAYRAFRTDGDVVLGGDSAGGGLALTVLSDALRQGTRPRGCFFFSPLTDLTFSGDSISENEARDPLLPASRIHDLAGYYLAGADAEDPRASPLFADYTDAPPVWLTVDDTEILRDDTLRLRDRMQAQGVDVTCDVTHGLPHVWPMFQNTMPEARRTLRRLALWLTRLLEGPTES